MVSTPIIIDDPSPVEALKHDSLPFAVSVGLHAVVLGLLLPNLSGFSTGANGNSPSNPHNVSVIKLSPAEQSRLPNLSDNISALPPTASSLPPLASSMGSLPIDASSYPSSSISALPPPPSLPPLAYNNNYPLPIRTAPNPAFLPFRTYPSPPNSLQPPTPLNTASLPNRAINPTATGERPQFSPLRSPIPPDDLINGRGLQTQPESNGQSVALNSSPPTPQLPAVNPADVRFNGENTSDDEAMRNNVRWMAKIGVLKPQAIEIAGTYPTPACPSQVKGSAVVGVATNEQGQVAAEPYLIKSSGFPILNQQALQDVRSQKLPGQGAYRVTVNYDYSPKVCPAVARTQPNLPALPTTPTSPTVAPAMTPANMRSPSPENPQGTRTQPGSVKSPGEARRDAPIVQPSPNSLSVPVQSQPKPSPVEARRDQPTVKPAGETVPSSKDLKPIPSAAPAEARNSTPASTPETPGAIAPPANSPEIHPLAPAASKKSVPSPAQVDPQVNESSPKTP